MRKEKPQTFQGINMNLLNDMIRYESHGNITFKFSSITLAGYLI